MQLPSRLGGFELTQRLGSGAMGTVYSAVQTALGRRVVVKTLHPHLMEDPDLIARFHREARHSAGLQHPNTVQVYDFGLDGDVHYIAMEFVDGLDLKEILSLLGPFPPEVATLVLRDICRGMEAAHRRDLVHRDIKPANLMITRTGVVKVMDFGLARETAESSTLTRHGSVMGSAAYMSPEQAQGLAVDYRTDVFSAGLVGYEIASGVRAFPGDNYAAVLRAVVFDEMEPLERHAEGLPAEFYQVIRSMTTKDLSERCPSMGAARDSLESLVGRLGLRGEDRILAEFVRRADEARSPGGPGAGVAPASGAAQPTPGDATALAPGSVPSGAEDATQLASGSLDAAETAPSGSGTPASGAGPGVGSGSRPASGASPGMASSQPRQPVGGTAGGASAGTDTGPGTGTPGIGGSGGAGSGGSGGAGTGPSVPTGNADSAPPSSYQTTGSKGDSGGGSGGLGKMILIAAIVLAAGIGGFFVWQATRPAPEPIRVSTACCFADGTCRLLPESECGAAGGIADASEACEPNPCTPTVGACCLPDGDCESLTEAECATEGGDFQGTATRCAETECRAPEGACCLPDGECRIETRRDCRRADGDFRGGDSVCEPNPCPQPEETGACCNGEECTIRTKTTCESGGGTYEGDGATCVPNPCAKPVTPAVPTSAVYTIATVPWMMVGVDGGDPNPNPENSFRKRLSFGRHSFHVRNVEAGIDTVFTLQVGGGDPNTILLDMLRCRCVKKVNR